MGKIKIFKDAGLIVFHYPKKEGKPHRVDSYFQTRAGLSWPTANSPGYFCIFGLENNPALTTDERPLVLLAENESHLLGKFFERLTINAKRLFCEWLFANMEDNQGFVNSFRKFIRERKINGLRLRDSAEFEDFEHNIALIRQRRIDGVLSIPKDTILGKQIRSMTPDDLKDKPEERFYAVMALSRVLGSFEAFPWKKFSKPFTGFKNFQHRIKKPISSDYQEYFAD
jgi:hypothetical protein